MFSHDGHITSNGLLVAPPKHPHTDISDTFLEREDNLRRFDVSEFRGELKASCY